MTVAPIITGPGKYLATGHQEAEVTSIDQGFAIGRIGERRHVWEASNGSARHPSNGDDIVGPWQPKAERAVTTDTPVIAGPGEYISRDGERVRIIAVAEGFAMGKYGKEGFVRTWSVDGSAYQDGSLYGHTITGPWPPKTERKRVEGWVVMSRHAIGDAMFCFDEGTARQRAKYEGVDFIPVTELLPDDHVIPGKAWEEAKQTLEKYSDPSVSSRAYGMKDAYEPLVRALRSLLLEAKDDRS